MKKPLVKKMTCIICPKGCSLVATADEEGIKIEGNDCPKGEKYALEEMTAPKRTVTSTVRVSNRENVMLSVKTASPIPKESIFDLMDIIRKTKVKAPVKIGDIIIDGLYGTQIISTMNVD